PLQRLLVMPEQGKFDDGAQETEHQHRENPGAQGSDPIGRCSRLSCIHRCRLYLLARASLAIWATISLYLLITSLTKAVVAATSGFSGMSAFSMSIIPFSMAT